MAYSSSNGSTAGTAALPGSDMPSASPIEAMVLAVNIPAQEPSPGQAARSNSRRSASDIWFWVVAPIPSKTSTIETSLPFHLPGRLEPPYRNRDGRLILAAAISMPGSDLSHPAMVTMASKRSACMTNSTESAMTSRETSDARMPSWPMEIPSETAIVVNSRPTPPAPTTPCFALPARRGPLRLQGVTSLPAETTPTWGLSKSSSLRPTQTDGPQHGPRPCCSRPLGHVVGVDLASHRGILGRRFQPRR